MIASVFATILSCAPPAGADALLVPGGRLIVGEVHGVKQTPAVVGELACAAAKKGPTRVALEIPVAEQPAITAFVKSNGDAKAMLAGVFWREPFQDGRRSAAMLALLDRVRTLRAQGADIAVTVFDGPYDKDRDRAMADRLTQAFAKEPKATFVVLVGNLHARKNSGTWKQRFMTDYLVAGGAKLTTLDARYGRGTAWVCTGAKPEDCGPSILGRGAGAAPAITLEPTPDGAYDGVLDVGVASFSPPAAVPLGDAQQLRAASIGQRLEALAAYEAKSYARCAQLYDALARMLRSSEDAYNAACCHALAGHAEPAFAALAQSVDFGLSDGDGLAKDSDLVALHKDARWQALVARVAAASSAKK